MGVSSRSIRVLSIVEGSVAVNMQINTDFKSAVCDPASTQSSLNSLLNKNSTVANMDVTYSSVTVNCGPSA
jgi:hypothetical protein